ncbi:MAG: formyltransferase family protein [Parcubacteria group bacterium]|jgi:phosphoribosylglycinamide formyltransferase-1
MSEKSKQRILVLASGDEEGGGSGLQELVEQSQTDRPILKALVAGVISNHARGGVWRKSEPDALNIPFEHWKGPYTAEGYQARVKNFQADFVMCSGWLKMVRGLDSAKTINIHPGPLPRFGGPGMYGHHVHEAVMEAFHRGEITQSAVTMHFVDEEYDHGPIFFQMPVFIRKEDTPETLAKRVNEKERAWQSIMLSLVVNGDIFLHDGKVHYADHFCKKTFFGV